MFDPKYTISDQLLRNIKRVYELVYELNDRRFSKVVLFEFERAAREVSAFASTSLKVTPCR